MTGNVEVLVLDDIDKDLDSKDKAIAEIAPEQKKNKSRQSTLVNFILDGSGSMDRCYDDAIGSFNTYVENLKADKSNYDFSLNIFSTSFKNVYTALKITDVPVLDKKVYIPSGGTALYDAIGSTVSSIDKKLAKKKTKNKVLVVILTDGDENSSREYSKSQIADVIKEHEERGNWTFIYLGANQDAFAVGTALNISAGNTMSYDTANIHQTMSFLSASTSNYASSADMKTSFFFADVPKEPEEETFDNNAKAKQISITNNTK